MTFNESELIDSINNKNIENFNNNGGIDMYIYKVSEEDSTSGKNAVKEKIKEIDSKYSIEEYVPKELKTLGLEEMKYEDRPSDEDIEKKAADSLNNYKKNEISKINNKFSSQFSDLREDAENALEDKSEDISSINSKYDSSVKRARNNSIDQGISRSSIINNALKAIEEEKGTKISEVEVESNKVKSRLENEKNILEQQKESALSSFDISYAVKLQNKIAGLNKEIAKEEEKVLKYNKEIATKEEFYKKEQEEDAKEEQDRINKKNKDLLKQIDQKGLTEVARTKVQEKYGILLDYLSGMPKAKAMDELQNDSMYKNELGPYYSLLYAIMLKRQD